MKNLSIIVLIHNANCYLDKCLSTIALFKNENFECLLLDDGTTDNIKFYIDKYTGDSPCFRYYKTDKLKISPKRNLGMDLAEGRYITFLDCDDFFDAEGFKFLLKNIHDFHEDFITFAYTEFYENNSKKCSRNLWDNQQEALIDAVTGHKLNTCWGKLYLKDIISTYKLMFNEQIQLGEDILFVLEYLTHIQSVKSYNNNLLFYRKSNPASATHNIDVEKYKDMFYIYNRTLEIADSTVPQMLPLIHAKYFNIYQYRMSEICSQGKFKEIKTQLMDFIKEDVFCHMLNSVSTKNLKLHRIINYLLLKKRRYYFVYVYSRMEKKIRRLIHRDWKI